MTVKALGYVIIETAKMAEWDHYMTEVVGVMRGEGAPGGTAFYRVDDRPFRFWVRPGDKEWLTAAGYEVESAAALDALKAKIAAAGRAFSAIRASRRNRIVTVL